MKQEIAKAIVKAPRTWEFTPAGVGMTAFAKRFQGVTLTDALRAADTEEELWQIADGWAEAAGATDYSQEMLEEIDELITLREILTEVLPDYQRDDYIGE